MTTTPTGSPAWERTTSHVSYGGDLSKRDLFSVGKIDAQTDVSASEWARLAADMEAVVRTAPFAVITYSCNDTVQLFPTVTDSSTNANHGTATNMESGDVSTDVPTGGSSLSRSMNFDGVDEYVEVGDVTPLKFERTNSFSFSAWFKATLAAESAILAKNAADPGYYMSVTAAGAIAIVIGASAANRIIVTSSTSGYDNNAWHHVVVTYSGNSLASGVTIYVDGASVAKTTIQDNLGSNSIQNTAAFRIGRQTNGSFIWTGLLDEVAVWNKALSAGEVTTVYDGGTLADYTTTGPSANLVGYWRMGDLVTQAPTVECVYGMVGVRTTSYAGDAAPAGFPSMARNGNDDVTFTFASSYDDPYSVAGAFQPKHATASAHGGTGIIATVELPTSTTVRVRGFTDAGAAGTSGRYTLTVY